MKYVVLFFASLTCTFIAKANEVTLVGSIHKGTEHYDASDLFDYIKTMSPDAILTEGDASMFHQNGSISKEASGLEIEAYRRIQSEQNIPVINVSMLDRNQKMKKIGYNQTLGQVFQVLQKAYKAGNLTNADRFEQILQTFPDRNTCMANSSFQKLQSEKCATAFKNNNDAIFNGIQTLLEDNPKLSDELNKWQKIVDFHNQRHQEIASNVATHVCSDSNKRYFLVVGVLHFSEVKRLLNNTGCAFQLRLYSEATFQA